MAHQQGELRDAYLELLKRSGLDLAFADHAPKSPPSAFVGGEWDPKASKAAVRYRDQSRGYATWEAVGIEPRANYLERLGTVRARGGPYLGDRLPIFQDVLDVQVATLLDAAGRAGVHLPFDFFVGIYPNGEFNAHPELVPGGALILIDAGLIDLLSCILRANLGASGSEQNPPLLQDLQTSMVLAEAFNAYLFGEGSFRAWSPPRLDPTRDQILGFLQRAGELFVIAHELGHVACGHIGPPVPGGGQAGIRLTPENELEADTFAVDLLVCVRGVGDDVQREQFLSAGMLNILSVAFALSALTQEFQLDEAATGTHPTLVDRWAHLGKLLTEHFPAADAVKRGEIFRRWLNDKYLGNIVEWLRQVDELIKRPGKWS